MSCVSCSGRMCTPESLGYEPLSEFVCVYISSCVEQTHLSASACAYFLYCIPPLCFPPITSSSAFFPVAQLHFLPGLHSLLVGLNSAATKYIYWPTARCENPLDVPHPTGSWIPVFRWPCDLLCINSYASPKEISFREMCWLSPVPSKMNPRDLDDNTFRPFFSKQKLIFSEKHDVPG